MENEWTRSMAQLLDDLDACRAEVRKWKATAEESEIALRIMQKDRDYWRDRMGVRDN